MKKTLISLILIFIFTNQIASAFAKNPQAEMVESYTRDALIQVLPMWLSDNGIELEKSSVEGVYERILDFEFEFIDTNLPRFHSVKYIDGKITITTSLNYAPSYINEYFIIRLLDRVSDDIIL